ncbi:hypothetical protein SFRURICE_003860 [Spodoptera frugiperda]|nr:hypothetical protein SFRURICE_003860 [Spodoptera frugiperda]
MTTHRPVPGHGCRAPAGPAAALLATHTTGSTAIRVIEHNKLLPREAVGRAAGRSHQHHTRTTPAPHPHHNTPAPQSRTTPATTHSHRAIQKVQSPAPHPHHTRTTPAPRSQDHVARRTSAVFEIFPYEYEWADLLGAMQSCINSSNRELACNHTLIHWTRDKATCSSRLRIYGKSHPVLRSSLPSGHPQPAEPVRTKRVCNALMSVARCAVCGVRWPRPCASLQEHAPRRRRRRRRRALNHSITVTVLHLDLYLCGNGSTTAGDVRGCLLLIQSIPADYWRRPPALPACNEPINNASDQAMHSLEARVNPAHANAYRNPALWEYSIFLAIHKV